MERLILADAFAPRRIENLDGPDFSRSTTRALPALSNGLLYIS